MNAHLKKSVFLICLIIIPFQTNVYAQTDQVLSGAEIQIALQKLNVLGSVLYLAAHPDDENTALLAYLSKGRKYRTAYLSLTRGDGGQNLLGSEKGAEIGILRTQELLEARKIDGAEQFFSNAIDFGYSKTAEESLEFWKKESVLADMVWVIRKFRPDIIITRFPPGGNSGHGHHNASASLAVEAFNAAGDPGKFPEQLKYLEPWKAKRLLWNNWRSRGQRADNALNVNVGEYNPVLGRSYSEMAALSRSKHKSQGFGSSGRRGVQYENFELVAGDAAESDIFEGINVTWNRIPGGDNISDLLDKIISDFDPEVPSGSVPELITLYSEMNRLGENNWLEIKKKELLKIISSCAGLWMEAIAEDYAAAPGDDIRITATVVNRSDYLFKLDKIRFPETDISSDINVTLDNNSLKTAENVVRIPGNIPESQPYWLRIEPEAGRFIMDDQILTGEAENPPSLRAVFTLRAGDNTLEYHVPVLYKWTDRVDGELYRPFEIRPEVTVNLEEKVRVFTDGSSREITVRLKSQSPNVTGRVRFRGTDGWKITPEEIPFSLGNRFDEKQVVYNITPPEEPGEAVITAEAEVDGEKHSKALAEISYPHINKQVYFAESRMKLVKLDIDIPESRIGYIMGAGDEVPEYLRILGYDVTLLSDEGLENGDLSEFDAIITGIRAYNTRERLKYAQPKLMEYVKSGGTLLVQYNVTSGLVTTDIGPYPFQIGRDRVSVETAPVKLTEPEHQLFQYPNKIMAEDFEGWIQERGLYFASQWDDRYETVLSSRDPNESEKHGSILFARYGEGIFIYSGISWFRQLPAGVPGAYRLFVNMISAGAYDGK
ncbi:PIG-L family deacetylase [candidate division KSB1 bacterium]